MENRTRKIGRPQSVHEISGYEYLAVEALSVERHEYRVFDQGFKPFKEKGLSRIIGG